MCVHVCMFHYREIQSELHNETGQFSWDVLCLNHDLGDKYKDWYAIKWRNQTVGDKASVICYWSS